MQWLIFYKSLFAFLIITQYLKKYKQIIHQTSRDCTFNVANTKLIPNKIMIRKRFLLFNIKYSQVLYFLISDKTNIDSQILNVDIKFVDLIKINKCTYEITQLAHIVELT